MHKVRTYRNWVQDKDLQAVTVRIAESDLFIRAEGLVDVWARQCLHAQRQCIQDYIQQDPQFAVTLKPYPLKKEAPPIVRDMAWAASSAGVGPMAAVAGALAQYVGRDLLKYSSEVIVENGGDIFVRTDAVRNIGIFAGDSCYTGKLALQVTPGTDWGICTSSGTVGHSLSLGRSDAATVVCRSAILADAWATRLGNMVNSAKGMQSALDFIKDKPGIIGALIIVGDKIGAWGKIKLVDS
jgi:ApbE superfamily uncharacterized protein (UPF0280 family)